MSTLWAVREIKQNLITYRGIDRLFFYIENITSSQYLFTSDSAHAKALNPLWGVYTKLLISRCIPILFTSVKIILFNVVWRRHAT